MYNGRPNEKKHIIITMYSLYSIQKLKAPRGYLSPSSPSHNYATRYEVPLSIRKYELLTKKRMHITATGMLLVFKQKTSQKSIINAFLI